MTRLQVLGLILVTPLAAGAAAFAAGWGWGVALKVRERWGARGLAAAGVGLLALVGLGMVVW